MFRIRRIYDNTSAANRRAIAQVRTIAARQFTHTKKHGLEHLIEQLQDPMRFRYRSILLVVEGRGERVRGFALMLHLPDLHIVFLDLISAAPDRLSGTGALLYQRVREETLALQAGYLFFECSVDDPALVPDAKLLAENRRRLKFYERLGVRPIIQNRYATPAFAGDTDLYYLMADDLGRMQPPSRATTRRVVRAVLARKYAELFDARARAAIARSFRDDPVVIRAPRYARRAPLPVPIPNPRAQRIALVVNEGHEIHHVHDRGYVEAPVRIDVILRELEPTGLFTRVAHRHAPEALLERVHDRHFIDYLRRACEMLPLGKSIYPVIFPIHNTNRPPADLELQVGYFCTDTFTPLHHNVWPAARGAVDCAYTAATLLLDGYSLTYALVRPPGHHAERRAYGGFCYFNSSAVAAEYLSHYGRVAVLDVDYHHGNGTQDIFYRRADVLTISIHGAPPTVYPHFAGFADETGEGEGLGFNVNLPLPERIEFSRYERALASALHRIRRFAPAYLVVCLGLDTAKGDPTGTWPLQAADFHACGAAIGRLRLPTCVVQEGGYRIRTLGVNARSFFAGLWSGALTGAAPDAAAGPALRHTAQPRREPFKRFAV